MKQYVIGYTSIDKLTKEKNEGIYINGSWGLALILNEEALKNKTKKDISKFSITIFDNIETCEKYCRALSRLYRTDDVAFKNPKEKSKKIRRFYPLKLNSPNLKWLKDSICLEKIDREGLMKYNEFAEKIEKPYPIQYYNFK